MILDNYHIIVADRAYHNFQASLGVINSVDTSGTHVKVALMKKPTNQHLQQREKNIFITPEGYG